MARRERPDRTSDSFRAPGETPHGRGYGAGDIPARVIARVQHAALDALISVVVGLLERRMRAALDRRR